MEDFSVKIFDRKYAGRHDLTYVECNDGCIYFLEGTYFSKPDDEDLDEECYGLILDREASEKLYSLIRKEGQSAEQAFAEAFMGVNILSPVEHYLKANGIPYKWSGSKYELNW